MCVCVSVCRRAIFSSYVNGSSVEKSLSLCACVGVCACVRERETQREREREREREADFAMGLSQP